MRIVNGVCRDGARSVVVRAGVGVGWGVSSLEGQHGEGPCHHGTVAEVTGIDARASVHRGMHTHVHERTRTRTRTGVHALVR